MKTLVACLEKGCKQAVKRIQVELEWDIVLLAHRNTSEINSDCVADA